MSHFNAHISLSQTLILPCPSTTAQSSHFWHEQSHRRQQSCQHKETWESNPPDVYPKGFHRQDFHGKLFPGEMVSLQTSTPAAWEPGPPIHTNISISLILGRRGGLLCVASSLPSHLSPPFTHHPEGCSLSDRSVTCVSAPPT